MTGCHGRGPVTVVAWPYARSIHLRFFHLTKRDLKLIKTPTYTMHDCPALLNPTHDLQP